MQSVISIPTKTADNSPLSSKQWLIGLLIAEVVSVVAPVFVLSSSFQFPDILRQPASIVLPLFVANQSAIIPAYYVFMVSGLLFVPLSYAFSTVLKPGTPLVLRQSLVGAGLATAIFQAIGFSRWLFIIPFLAGQYSQQPAQVPAIALLYETLNRYAGMTIGEHLGFLSMGCWTIMLALLLIRSGITNRWFAALGLPIGAALLASTLEHFGGSTAELFGIINFMANTGWSGWMLGLTGWVIAGLLSRKSVH